MYLYLIIFQFLVFIYETEQRDGEMCLQGFSPRLKIETRRTDASSWWHASRVCVIYETLRDHSLTLIRFMGGKLPLSIKPSHVSADVLVNSKQKIKIETFDISRYSHPTKFPFSITSHSTCFKMTSNVHAVPQNNVYKLKFNTKGCIFE